MTMSKYNGRPRIDLGLTDEAILTGNLSALAREKNVSVATIARRRREILAANRIVSEAARPPRSRTVKRPVRESAPPSAPPPETKPVTVNEFVRTLLGEFTLTKEGATVSHATYARLVALALA
jgi:hypothetical protein